MELLVQHRWALPSDMNTQNVLFGGRLLEWVDQDASMACYKILKPETQLLTAGMDRVSWINPVSVGERLKFTYTLAHIGRSAVTVYVTVESQTQKQVFRGLVSLVCLSYTKTPSEASAWLKTELKGTADALRSSPLWDLVEKTRNERKSDPVWAQT
jgi:acyl-CoA hydrolase